MLHQHLNLLDPRLLPQAVPMSATHTLLAAAAVAVGTWTGAWALQNVTTELQGQLGTATTPPVLTEAAGATALAALQQELAQLRAIEAVQQQLQHGLQAGTDGAPGRRSLVFKALSRQAQGSLSITGFKVSAAGDAVDLEGRMADASALPSFLRQLNNEAPFAGLRFAALQISTPAGGDTAAGPQRAAFTLRALPPAAGDAP